MTATKMVYDGGEIVGLDPENCVIEAANQQRDQGIVYPWFSFAFFSTVTDKDIPYKEEDAANDDSEAMDSS